MREIRDDCYRDETRIVHMLQALERIEREKAETSRDKLPMQLMLEDLAECCRSRGATLV